MNLALPELDQLSRPPDEAAGMLLLQRAERGFLRAALRALEGAFNQPFSLLEADSGEIFYAASSGLTCDYYPRLAVLAEAARRGRPEIIEQESPLSLLAVPLKSWEHESTLVAVSVLLNERVEEEAQIASAARVFGVDARRALEWSRQSETWSPRVLLRLAEATLDNLIQRAQLSHLQHEVNEAVGHVRDTHVELGLLNRLARRLDVSQPLDELWRTTVQWLADAVPAQCVAVVARRDSLSGWRPLFGEHGPPEIIHGECPVDPPELSEMMERLGKAGRRPLVINRPHTSSPTWAFPTVRELASAPIIQGSQLEGWILTLNHSGLAGAELCEFGSAELRLLESVSSVLGVHRHNAGLFACQGDLFAASVRALTSAIDAKDTYTRGHSERVARLSVCLAEQLGLTKEQLDTLYLGGLLHDIGKIGIDDQVLNKCGPLTPEEFEQIKKHPQLGYDILRGVRQLQKILPIVLHHHEAWDGSGYPHGLQGESTPLVARVLAVADSYDAMSSDRPYRPGMPQEQIDQILRAGAGKQWDPEVVDAFFGCQARMQRASTDETVGAIPLDPFQWLN
ncbi:MAG: HD-GYP domain-containing protein [Pirellulales bacterium]|nr:HD-GYP domain-containing protein [Pirellulales bacterium]